MGSAPVALRRVGRCTSAGVGRRPRPTASPLLGPQHAISSLATAQGALVDFENVAALEPRNYMGDSGSRVTPILPVTHYNIACCYSMLGQVRAAQ